MDELKIKTDISKEILESTPKVVSRESAEKEEEIAKAVSKIPTPENNDDFNFEKRKKDSINFLKKNINGFTYAALALIVFIGVYIRTLNISKLKDVTTGDWTLGPDLDPFLFLRWAKYIVENGSLFTVDLMRNFPLGHNTNLEMKLLSYMIVWFYKLISFIPKSILPGNPAEVTVTYGAILFPVFMFAITIIAFFLFAKKIFSFEKPIIKNSIAIISTLFFAITPSLLPRTIAGIPEKESASFFFIFMSFYFILEAFTSKKMKNALVFGILAGIMTGILALIWGGATFVFMTIAAATLVAFLLGKANKKLIYSYSLWIISFCIIMMPFSARYTLKSLIGSVSTGASIAVLAILIIDLFLIKKDLLKIKNKLLKKINLPSPLVSLIVSIIILIILSSLFLGLSFIPDKVMDVIDGAIHPLDVSRFGLTVAENKQPFFIDDWKNSFGPTLNNLGLFSSANINNFIFNAPIYFWLFFVGSIALFGKLIEKMKKEERIVLILGYTVFLLGLIFSNFSIDHKVFFDKILLDGNTPFSFILYFGGMIIFLGLLLRYYIIRYKKGAFDIFSKFDISYVLYFVILSMTIVGARGAVRLIMVLAAIVPIVVGFLVVKTIERFSKEKNDSLKMLFGFFVIIVCLGSLFTAYTYYQNDKYTGENFAPGTYQWQWQNAMSWVRQNTSETSVFAHWWDYGYWVQSIGERATILDGGNAITYWNHLFGRHVLTGTSDEKALEFMYAHNTTHLLIDSTEIGKYTAYSSIGADENYDRFSWIATFLLNDEQTIETANSTTYVYTGGTATDEDIIWTDSNGKEVLLPKKQTIIGGIIFEAGNAGEINQPTGVFFYNNQRYNIPLRNIFISDKLITFEDGIDAGVFIYPSIIQGSNGLSINPIGASFYLSSRTVHSGIARWYLFGEESEYIKLAHSEPNAIVENLNAQSSIDTDFVYYQGFQGPIKIWEISYPNDITFNKDFLIKDYPNATLILAKSGEYN